MSQDTNCRYCVRAQLKGNTLLIDADSPVETLPEYVSRLAVENSELHATVSLFKDFVRDICHSLEMSLESNPQDLLNRIKLLKDSALPPSYAERLRRLQLDKEAMNKHFAQEAATEKAKHEALAMVAEQRRRTLAKLRGSVDDFVQVLADEGFIKLSEEEPDV